MVMNKLKNLLGTTPPPADHTECEATLKTTHHELQRARVELESYKLALQNIVEVTSKGKAHDIAVMAVGDNKERSKP